MLPSLAPELHSPSRLPFIKKLLNFLADHQLDVYPVLVLQCSPVDPQRIDMTGRPIDQTLLQGSNRYIDGAWWSSFGGGSRGPVFDGYRCVDANSTEGPLWAVEIHDDGNILAAVRAIAHSDMPGVHPVILEAFSDFAILVERLQSAAQINGAINLTATLVNAKGLELLSFASYSRTRSRSVGREIVEWPVMTAANREEADAATKQLAARFKRMFP